MIGVSSSVAALLLLAFRPDGVSAANDGVIARQKAAIEAFDAAHKEYLKTGDMTTFTSKLNRSARELSACLEEFNRAHNSAGAGLSLLKLGEIYRFQGNLRAAFGYFLTAIAQAQIAGDAKTRASALIGAGRCEYAGTKDYAAAGAHFREAVTVASALTDRTPLFNALSWQAQVEVALGNLIGAADLLARAFALTPQLQDQSLVLFAHLDRADVFVQLSKKSEATKAYSAQLESLQLAQADYEAALKVAHQFGYATLYPTIEGFLNRLAIRRQMAETNTNFSKMLGKTGVFAPKKPSDVMVNEQFVPDRVDLPEPRG